MKLLATAGLILLLAPQTLPAQTPLGEPPSSLLKPALDELRQTIGAVQLGRWKGPNAAKDEVDANLTSIRKDLDGTLPALLAKADATPASVASTLPVTRNVGALYDVLLRVVERARASAPSEQMAALDRARTSLDAARRSLEDRMQSEADALEVRIVTLQKTVDSAQVAPPPTTVSPDMTKKKKTTKRKPVSPPQ